MMGTQLAQMTESQKVWESWFQAFKRVHAAWPEQAEVPCPRGDGFVRVAYVGDPVDRIGTAYAWCDDCDEGIYLTRVGIPEGAPLLPYDAPEAEKDAVIPPDLEFLDPDPAPPAEDDN
jgi:hypothetical protein